MRTWYVVGKYPIYTDGKITHTEITLATLSGSYGTFTERVIGDQTGKTNDELIELARDAYFKAEYADKAMPEAVQKVDEMSNKSLETLKFRFFCRRDESLRRTLDLLNSFDSFSASFEGETLKIGRK